jgi:heptosyltransferase I
MRARGNPALRVLDRYAGIPVVAVGSIVRRRRPLPERIERIGVLNSTNIGDTVLLSAVARDLSAAFPVAETVLFASPETLPLARLVPGVRAVPLRILRPTHAVRALRREQLDVVLDFDQWPRAEPVYCLLSAARWAGGFRARGQHRHYCYDGTVDHSDQLHELDNHRRLVSLLGVDSHSLPRFDPPHLLAPSDLPSRPYVIFHPWPTGVRSQLREWPWERWQELARQLGERGYTLVLTGSTADSERATRFIEFCDQHGVRMVNTAGAYDLAQLVDVVCGSACVVSVNTGVMHLAAAAGAPTVALNGPTSERRWGPIGERARSVNSTYDGCGYLNFGWEYGGQRRDCMLGIQVEDVLTAVLELIGDS